MSTLLEVVTRAVELSVTDFEVTDSNGTYSVSLGGPTIPTPKPEPLWDL